APSRNVKILTIPIVLAHGKSYKHSFRKKYILCKVTRKVEFRSVFRGPSRNLKILVIPNVFAHGKSYMHGFTKKCDGHKHCTKLSFDQFFVHRLEILKYWSFPTY
ncbi:hypothetical protein B296_00054440, partial [Ensete ventricosum]